MTERLLYVAAVLVLAWCLAGLGLAFLAAWFKWCRDDAETRDWVWRDFDRRRAEWERMRQAAKDHRQERDGI